MSCHQHKLLTQGLTIDHLDVVKDLDNLGRLGMCATPRTAVENDADVFGILDDVVPNSPAVWGHQRALPRAKH